MPPRCRLTRQLREQAAAEVAARGSRRASRHPESLACRLLVLVAEVLICLLGELLWLCSGPIIGPPGSDGFIWDLAHISGTGANSEIQAKSRLEPSQPASPTALDGHTRGETQVVQQRGGERDVSGWAWPQAGGARWGFRHAAHWRGADRHRWRADRVSSSRWGDGRGAVRLCGAALPLALVTNTSSRTRTSIAAALAVGGLCGHRRR